MRDELLLYYERELTWLRQMGAQFAGKYPKVASRLLIEPGKCEDPHVERLLEAFAFLAARVHLKVDDEFPEITQALLSIVYPHFVRPIPSMSIVEFQVDVEQGGLTSGLKIEKQSMLYSKRVAGVPCQFRTCYDTTLWPLAVKASSWTSPDRLRPALEANDAAHAVRVELHSAPGCPLPKLGIDRLRFHLFGEGSLVHVLYELLCSRLTAVAVRDPSNPHLPPVMLPPSCLRPVGFADDEGMLPYPRRSFTGYRLLQEYFAMPEKFLFVDVTGLEGVWGGFKNAVELVFLISTAGGEDRRQRLEIGISPSTFRLGCTPIINLFPKTAEPLLMDQRKYEYPVIPDIRRPNATEVFSVDTVSSIDASTRETVTYQPFYSYRHESLQKQLECFWTASSRISTRADDDALDVFLTLVDRSMRPAFPNADTLTIHTTCSNRNLPARLPFGNLKEGDFELETNAPIKLIVALKKPTLPLRPRTSKAALWQLVSHLSLNYLSLVSEGREALQQILRLYDFTDSQVAQRMIEGISALHSKPHFARLVSENGISFVRGTRVEIDFDEEQFVGGGTYLFASVIEQFLALYASLNSFTQLVATVREGKEVLREWPPRAGQNILI